MSTEYKNGVVTIPSRHSVNETVEGLRQLLAAKGVHVFAIVDHSGEAERVGLKMPTTKLIIFGNPQAGTPLMLATPTIALDLPLKILVWEDEHSQCWISYNHSDYLQRRHSLPSDLTQTLRVAGSLAEQVAL